MNEILSLDGDNKYSSETIRRWLHDCGFQVGTIGILIVMIFYPTFSFSIESCIFETDFPLGSIKTSQELKILLDTLLDSQFENTPRHPCDSHFPKGISALSWSFLLENWNKTNVYEMITHYTSCQQCRTVSNSVNSVNSVNSYSAVLPPSPMVFFFIKIHLVNSSASSFDCWELSSLNIHSKLKTGFPPLWIVNFDLSCEIMKAFTIKSTTC